MKYYATIIAILVAAVVAGYGISTFNTANTATKPLVGLAEYEDADIEEARDRKEHAEKKRARHVEAEHAKQQQEIIKNVTETYVFMGQKFDEMEVTEMSDAERKIAQEVRQMEKLTRDAYMTLAQRHNSKVLEKMAESEQTHMDAVRQVLERYDVTDPITDHTIGVFADQDIAAQYRAATNSGTESEVAAMAAMMQLEEMVIAQLRAARENTTNTDAQVVYGDLLRAARNHMRISALTVGQDGYIYTPRHLPVTDFVAIVEAPHERVATQ